ncbi:MAG: hypothetical protein COB04_12820 [Gammaproteobacteria bacterium]|nr:MAG: hypothetical protein COB04_12820 [Gammaproteobacteria bacterium]
MATKPSVGQLIAIVLCVSLSTWMVMGYQKKSPGDVNSNPISSTTKAFQVAVFNSRAQPIQKTIRVDGTTKANRQLTLKSEISGKVIELGAQKGDILSASEIILKIDPVDLPSKLESAQTHLKQRQIEYQSAHALYENSYLTKALMAQADSALKSAQSKLDDLEQRLQQTVIRAPFGGTLEELHIELGSIISKGETIGTLLDYHPLLVTGHLPESEIGHISLGSRATAQLSNGKSWHGRISYIASSSDPFTKTFNFELKIISSEYDSLSGLSATIKIPQPIILAHYISPALLQINRDGKLGLKVVNADKRVEFKPIKLVKSTEQGMWVSGLEITSQIISRGQGYVVEGERVDTQLIQAIEIDRSPLVEDFSIGYIKEHP